MSLIQIILTFVLFVFLVLLVAFFASSETAYLSISNITLRRMLKNKEKGAKNVEKLKNQMDSLLTIVLIGINFISTFAASVGAAVAIYIIGPHGVTVATILITLIITIGGEIVPKTIATERPSAVAKNNAMGLLILKRILFPIIWIFTKISQAAASIAEKAWKNQEPLITEEEIRTLIDVSTKEGTIEKSEKNMLSKLFEFNDLHVYDIMRHRSLIRAIPSNIKSKELVEAFTQSGFSRLPVFKDSIENIIGVIHYKDLLFAGKKEINSLDFIQNHLSSVLFIPESLTSIELLLQFKQKKEDFAIALDEQGSVSGIVTIDDILRSVFGRMTDEFSLAEVAPEKRIKIISANEFIVPGDMRLNDVNEILKLNLESEDFLTLGGWLLEKFDSLPSTGEAIKKDGMLFVIEDQARRRIQMVRIKLNIN